jgi:2-haloacid dehalogenase
MTDIKDFNRKNVFVFDAFGTLFKASEIDVELKTIAGAQTENLLALWRRKQLEYSWLRNQMSQYVPFHQVTKEALDFSMRFHGLKDERIFEILLPIYDHPGLIDGAKEVLDLLKEQQKTVCILSNGTRKMLNNGVQIAGVEHLIDYIFSVDDIGIYKPHPSVYGMAIDQLNAPKEELLFFSSNQWDVSGASTFGIDSVWVNQYQEVKESLPFGNVFEISSLLDIQF